MCFMASIDPPLESASTMTFTNVPHTDTSVRADYSAYSETSVPPSCRSASVTFQECHVIHVRNQLCCSNPTQGHFPAREVHVHDTWRISGKHHTGTASFRLRACFIHRWTIPIATKGLRWLQSRFFGTITRLKSSLFSFMLGLSYLLQTWFIWHMLQLEVECEIMSWYYS